MPEPRSVSDVQWAALELIVSRADGQQPTHVVKHVPDGDAAVQEPTARALVVSGFVTITGTTCFPTRGGRAALASHRRVVARRAETTS